MKPEDKIKKLINESDVTTSSNADKRILTDALGNLNQLKQKNLAVPRPNIWRFITKGGVTKIAVAAAILITFAIGFSIGRWSKPTRLAPHSLNVTGYTSAVPVYPTAPKVEDSFWRQKALAAMHPRPYAQTQTTKTSLLNTYKQYLKEKHYD